MSEVVININETTGATWMYNYSDKTLADLILPGTHNSAITTINTRNPLDSAFNKWYFKVLNYVAPQIFKSWTVNQKLSVKDQLNIGVRYIELKLSVYENNIYVSHTFQGPSLVSILDEIKLFYDEIPLSQSTVSVGEKSVEPLILVLKTDHENRKKFDLIVNKKLLTQKLKDHSISKYISEINNPINQPIRNFKEKPIILVFEDNLYMGEIGIGPLNIYDKWFDTNNEKELEGKIDKALTSSEYKNADLKLIQNILTPKFSDISKSIVLFIYILLIILYLIIISLSMAIVGYKDVLEHYMSWISLVIILISWPIYYLIFRPPLSVIELSKNPNKTFIKNIPNYKKNLPNIVMVDNITEEFASTIINLNTIQIKKILI